MRLTKASGYGLTETQETLKEQHGKLRRRYLYLADRPRTPETVQKLNAAIKALTEFESKNRGI